MIHKHTFHIDKSNFRCKCGKLLKQADVLKVINMIEDINYLANNDFGRIATALARFLASNGSNKSRKVGIQ